MGSNTKIQWAHHTFNPWRGCAKVAAGCMNCYAEAQSKRNPKTLGVWGPNGTRVVASESMWRQPVGWNKDAACHCDAEGHCSVCLDGPPRVFCGSLCDVFEDWPGIVIDSKGRPVNTSTWAPIDSEGPTPATLADVRARLFRLIDSTPSLDWLLLTKRPENVRRLWPTMFYPTAGAHGGNFLSEIRLRCLKNVRLGVSIACQEDADRDVPELLKCRDLCAKTFLSIEPLIGLVDLDECWPGGMPSPGRGPYVPGVDWVIVGGESGPNARPCDISWIRSIVRQCKDAGVPCFVKQLGARCVKEHAGGDAANTAYHPHGWVSQVGKAHHAGWFKFSDKKGGDPAEWPEDVRVREVP